MHMVHRQFRDPQSFMGKTVRTTRNVTGVVIDAWLLDGKLVVMQIEETNGLKWYTDHEHATIVRDES